MNRMLQQENTYLDSALIILGQELCDRVQRRGSASMYVRLYVFTIPIYIYSECRHHHDDHESLNT